MKKYFYIDEQGNKKKYIGNVIKNSDGSLKGILTDTIITNQRVQLHKVEQGTSIVKSEVNHYFIDDLGNKQIIDLDDNNVINTNNGYKYNISTKETVDLKFNKDIPEKIYYTYKDKSNNEVLYTDNVNNIKFDEINNKYYV